MRRILKSLPLTSLETAYPAARKAALRGDATALTALHAELERRSAKAREWLDEDPEDEERAEREQAGFEAQEALRPRERAEESARE
jgi:hypothetical protein